MGIGEQKTPSAFVKSCEIFTYCENLDSQPEAKPEKPVKKAAQKEKGRLQIDLNIVNKAFDMSNNESNEVNISTIGFNLRQLDPAKGYVRQ